MADTHQKPAAVASPIEHRPSQRAGGGTSRRQFWLNHAIQATEIVRSSLASDAVSESRDARVMHLQNRNPCICRGFLSRPVSRILSRATIHLGRRFPGGSSSAPGSSAGRLVAEPVRLAPDGVWRAAVSPRRWWALTPPFHPYLRRLRRDSRSPVAVSFLCHFPSAFAAWGFPSVLPCGVRTFLGPLARPAVTRPASPIVAAPPSSLRAPSRTRGRRSARPGGARTRHRPGTRGSRPA